MENGNKFERFIEKNFAKVPAIMKSKTKEYMSNVYSSALIHAKNCEIESSLSSFSRFCSLARQIQDETVAAYNSGLITNIEMMNIVTKFGDFIDKDAPDEVTHVFGEKCNCITR